MNYFGFWFYSYERDGFCFVMISMSSMVIRSTFIQYQYSAVSFVACFQLKRAIGHWVSSTFDLVYYCDLSDSWLGRLASPISHCLRRHVLIHRPKSKTNQSEWIVIIWKLNLTLLLFVLYLPSSGSPINLYMHLVAMWPDWNSSPSKCTNCACRSKWSIPAH